VITTAKVIVYTEKCQYCGKKLASTTPRRLEYITRLHLVGSHWEKLNSKPSE
jgi:hypothetical protein